MMLGLDYSAGRPSGAAIRAARYGFVMRYLDNGLAGRANLTAPEFMDLTASGVQTGLVWERKLIGRPDRATEGRAAGAADAAAAAAAARAATGLDGYPIYFAVDFDLPDYAPGSADPMAKLGPVGDYFGGIRSVLPLERVGVYGGYYAVKRILDAGLASLAWQTAAWSGGQEDPRIHVFQRVGSVYVAGVECDVNEARNSEFGYRPATAGATTGEDTMFQFFVKDGTRKPDGSYPDDAVLLVIGGTAYPSTWAQVQAKQAEHTAELAGLPQDGPGGFNDVRDTGAALRAAPAKLDAILAALKALPSGPSGTGGATKTDVQQIVDAAFLDHNATLTYNKITTPGD